MPIITNYMAVSLDGRISTFPQESALERARSGFTNLADFDFLMQELAHKDCVITGAHSLRSEGKVPVVRRATAGGSPYVDWIVMTRKGLAQTLEFFQQDTLNRFVLSPAALVEQKVEQQKAERSGVSFLTYDPQAFAPWFLQFCATRGYEKIALFGGGQINALFYRENLVDELYLTLCPKIVGQKDASYFVNPELPHAVALRLMSSQVWDHHVLLGYKVLKS